MGKSDYASSATSHSDDQPGGPVPLDPPRTPAGNFTFHTSFLFFYRFGRTVLTFPFIQIAGIFQRDLRDATPCLIQSQSTLMNNQRSYISPEQFEANLVQDLAWITRQLATKKLHKELFDSYQLAGIKCERLLLSKSSPSL
jgi:hypothetical protein